MISLFLLENVERVDTTKMSDDPVSEDFPSLKTENEDPAPSTAITPSSQNLNSLPTLQQNVPSTIDEDEEPAVTPKREESVTPGNLTTI